MNTKPRPVSAEEIRREARSRGADLVGFAPVVTLEKTAPAEKRPSTITEDAKTLVVTAKRTLHGITWSRHLPSKQLAGGRSLRVLDRIGGHLADWLEKRGSPSLPLASAALDFNRRGPEDVTPAGQGSFLLRLAAVEAGLATWGLNTMVLTPEFGPRVYLGGVLTQLELEPDRQIDGELCLGLEECGRCAAVCPEDAIPRRAPVGAPVREVRSLNCTECAHSCQPYGYQVFEDFSAHILESREREQMFQRIHGRMTGEIWLEMTMMKEAAITGCSDCTQVCPVGKDYDRVKRSPHRQEDLPEVIPRTIKDGYVEIEHLGPRVRRKITWKSYLERRKTSRKP